jgi:hypothetical protein
VTTTNEVKYEQNPKRSHLEEMFGETVKRVANYKKEVQIETDDAGKILVQLKKTVPHGEWLPYLSQLCERYEVGVRAAQKWMAKASHEAPTKAELPDPRVTLFRKVDLMLDVNQSLTTEGIDGCTRVFPELLKEAIERCTEDDTPFTIETRTFANVKQKVFRHKRDAGHLAEVLRKVAQSFNDAAAQIEAIRQKAAR